MFKSPTLLRQATGRRCDVAKIQHITAIHVSRAALLSGVVHSVRF